MSLNIIFRCRIFNQRAVVNAGVHVVLDDGCRFAIT